MIIRTIFIYFLCAIIGSFIVSSPLLMLFGFYKMKSRIGKVAIAVGIIGFIAFILADLML